MVTVKEFFRKSWGYIVAGISIFIGLFLFKRKSDDYQLQIDDLKTVHKKELEEVYKARELERKQYEENEKKYQLALKSIQKQYDDAKKILDDKKKENIKEIIVKYGKRPDVLAQKLSEVTGFKVVLPPGSEP